MFGYFSVMLHIQITAEDIAYVVLDLCKDERYIGLTGRYLGFTDISVLAGIGQNGRFYQ